MSRASNLLSFHEAFEIDEGVFDELQRLAKETKQIKDAAKNNPEAFKRGLEISRKAKEIGKQIGGDLGSKLASAGERVGRFYAANPTNVHISSGLLLLGALFATANLVLKKRMKKKLRSKKPNEQSTKNVGASRKV